MTDRPPPLAGVWRAPFRTPPLSGEAVGWIRPALAVLAAMVIPAVLAIAVILIGGPTIIGPPKDGSGMSFGDHLAAVLAALTTSVVVSWIAAPLALLALRAAAMLGLAGWGSAILAAWFMGLPTVHVALNGDLTTEDPIFLPHIALAIGALGLTVWAMFWAQMRRRLR